MKGTTEERFWAKLERPDAEGGCWLWTAGTVKGGYGWFWAHGRDVQAHRFSYELCVGPIPDGHQLDHRPTCQKRCVNPEHLRPATNKQNSENKAGARRDSKSGIRGVYPGTGRRKHLWVAVVGHNGKNIHVGYFEDVHEAEKAVIAKRLELFTHNDLDRQGVA